MSDSQGNPLSRSDSDRAPEDIAREAMEDRLAMAEDPDSSSEDLDPETNPGETQEPIHDESFVPPEELAIKSPFHREASRSFSKESSPTSKSSESESDSDSVTSVLSGKRECDIDELCACVTSKRASRLDGANPSPAWQQLVATQGCEFVLKEIYNCRCVTHNSLLAAPVLTDRKLGRVSTQATSCTEEADTCDPRDSKIALPVRLIPRINPEGCCNQVWVQRGKQLEENVFASCDTGDNVIVVHYPAASSLAALLDPFRTACHATKEHHCFVAQARKRFNLGQNHDKRSRGKHVIRR